MANTSRTPPLAELRKRKSAKWRLYSEEILPLPVAEMDFEIAEPIKSALREMIDRSDTGYLGPFSEMFIAFQGFARDSWGWNPEIAGMQICTDVGVGTVEVIRTLIEPGDKVLLNSPVYDNMWRWVAEVKAELVDVPLLRENMSYELDLAGIERAYQAGVRVHILCNPHNPVGKIFSRQTLTQLAELALRYKVIIISDEIHAPLSFIKEDFTPFLNVSDSARAVGVIVTSASKAFNLAGLKCAMIITANEELKKHLERMPISVAFRASLFGAVAATAAFENSQDWLVETVQTLDENRKYLRSVIDSEFSMIRYREPDFGYLAWLDLSELGLGENPAEILLERGKLAVNPGNIYGPNASGLIRLNFGTSREILSEAFHRIESSIR
jgi:cystathionine beta-lyase